MNTTADPYLSASRDPAAPRAGGRGLPAVEGSMTALTGIAMILLPEATIALVVALFALVLLARGVLRLLQALVSGVPGRARLFHAGLGAMSLGLGALVLARPPQSAVLLSTLIGLYWLAGGVIQFAAREDLLPATLAVLAAMLLLTVPAVSPAFLAVACGLCLFLWGLTTVVGALRRGRTRHLLRRG